MNPSNYPPGVTGNEPEIAEGPDDDEEPEEPTSLLTPEEEMVQSTSKMLDQQGLYDFAVVIYEQPCDLCKRPTYGHHEGQNLADAVICEDCCKELVNRSRNT